MTINCLNIKRFIRQLSFISFLALISSTSLAGIYKWTDEEGNVHYGQQRPQNTSSEKMNVPRYAPENTSTYKRPGQKDKNANGVQDPTDNAEKKASKEKPEPKLTRAEKKQRLEDCNQVRQNLATMESRGRVRSQDEDGNTRYLTQAEKEARMAKSKKTLSQFCK